jgi:SsrA-binding protein
MAKSQNVKNLAVNKNAARSYILIDKYEAGIELKGTEVKSIKAGNVSLKECYGFIKNGEVFVKKMHIKPYEQGNINNHDPMRIRRLLLHKHEIEKLATKVLERGCTLVVTRLYLAKGRVKMEIALAKGKNVGDKRQDVKKREAKRDIARAMKNYK